MTHILRINEMHPDVYMSAADKREKQIKSTPLGLRKKLPKHILDSPQKLRSHAQKMDKTPKVYELISRCKEDCTNWSCDYEPFEWVNKDRWINTCASEYEACYLTKDDIKEMKNNKYNSDIEYKFDINQLENNVEYPFVLISDGGIWSTSFIMLLLDLERTTPKEYYSDTTMDKMIATKYQLCDTIDFMACDNGHNTKELEEAEKDWNNMLNKLKNK